MKLRLLAAAVLLTVASTGCADFFGKSKTAPSIVTPDMMNGAWSSVAVDTTLPNTCTKFVWNVTQITDKTASGSFHATCQSNVLLVGTATGTLSEKTLTWSGTGTANVPNDPKCAISLAGSGTFDGLQMRIPFSGTTCVGEVTGTEILRKG